jgi:hypothetical protein
MPINKTITSTSDADEFTPASAGGSKIEFNLSFGFSQIFKAIRNTLRLKPVFFERISCVNGLKPHAD